MIASFGRGLQKTAVVFVADDLGLKLFLVLPLMAPFLEDDHDDILEQRDFDFGEVAFELSPSGRVPPSMRSTMVKARRGLIVENAHAEHRLGFEQAKVSRDWEGRR